MPAILKNMCGFWDTLKNKKKTYIVLTLPQDFCWSPGDQAYIIWFCGSYEIRET